MTALKWLAIPLLLYAGVAALMFFAQRSLMYFPERQQTSPAQAGFPAAEEIALTSSDGEKILAWHVAPREGMPIVLYFHGNGGALRHRVPRFRWLTADGYGLVALSYRGYGGSNGSPSEDGLIADANAAYDFARSRYPGRRIVVWGESLGTGVAVALAASHPVDGVILQSPFTSAAEVAASVYWFLPVRLLMKDQFRSDERIAKVRAPLLVLHGALDNVVPIAFGEKLFALASEPKHFVRFARGNHSGLDDQGAPDEVRVFLKTIR